MVRSSASFGPLNVARYLQVLGPAGAPPPRRARDATDDGSNQPAATPADARHRPNLPPRSRASPATPNLDGIPAEVLLRILSFLSASDLVSCCTVSRALAAAAVGCSPGTDQLWRRLFRAR